MYFMLQVDFSTQEAVKLGFRNVLDLEIRYIFMFLSVSLINAITVLDMNIYIAMKLKKITRIFKICLLSIEKYIFYKF